MKLIAITNMLVSLLRDNLPNPHASGQWIYSDYPLATATFPRISVTQTSGSMTKEYINNYIGNDTQAELSSIEYEIDVWLKVNDRITVEEETYVGTKLRDYYSDLIIDTILGNRQELKENYGILDVDVISYNSVTFEEDNQFHRKNIKVKLSVLREI